MVKSRENPKDNTVLKNGEKGIYIAKLKKKQEKISKNHLTKPVRESIIFNG